MENQNQKMNEKKIKDENEFDLEKMILKNF